MKNTAGDIKVCEESTLQKAHTTKLTLTRVDPTHHAPVFGVSTSRLEQR